MSLVSTQQTIVLMWQVCFSGNCRHKASTPAAVILAVISDSYLQLQMMSLFTQLTPISSFYSSDRKQWHYYLFFFFLAKTEYRAEMEVPTATKVKVVDFFQRLVCGLLIPFHSHHCCCFFLMWWLVYSWSDVKQLWICALSIELCNLKPKKYSLLNKTNQGWTS